MVRLALGLRRTPVLSLAIISLLAETAILIFYPFCLDARGGDCAPQHVLLPIVLMLATAATAIAHHHVLLRPVSMPRLRHR